MKLIVGLGNPGKEYEKTRHNMGFLCIDYFAKKNNVEINKNKFDGLYTELIYKQEKILLLKPMKYINLSGEVIKKYIDFYKIDVNDILIISDDLDMPFGKLKLKYKGSSGGHNGLKNIEQHLKTQEYKRIKIGISNNKEIDTKDYVLGKIKDDKLLNDTINKVSEVLKDYVDLSFDNLMNKYNKWYLISFFSL